MAPALPEVENSLFNAALTAGFAAQGKRQLRSEMATVSNQVLVALSVDFGDLEAVRVAVEMTHNYLNLALEHLAGGDLRIAIEHLRDTHLQQLFRLGVSLTIDLRTRAQQMVMRLGLDPKKTREIPYLDTPYREAIAEHVWGSHFDPFSNVIDVYMNRLRKKIDQGFEHHLLHTRRSEGYTLSSIPLENHA